MAEQKNLSIEELKARAYDLINLRESANQQLQQVNQMIKAKGSEEDAVEELPEDNEEVDEE